MYRIVDAPIDNIVARCITLLWLPHDEQFERVGACAHIPRDELNLLRSASTKLKETKCILQSHVKYCTLCTRIHITTVLYIQNTVQYIQNYTYCTSVQYNHVIVDVRVYTVQPM